MTTVVHPAIYNFLKDWLEWVDNGAIEPNFLFASNKALCSALYCYLRRGTILNMEQIFAIKREFKNLLFKTTGESVYPFNNGSCDLSRELYEEGGAHTNLIRMAWVRSIVNYEQPTVA